MTTTILGQRQNRPAYDQLSLVTTSFEICSGRKKQKTLPTITIKEQIYEPKRHVEGKKKIMVNTGVCKFVSSMSGGLISWEVLTEPATLAFVALAISTTL
jgi:hypothetical protein